MNRHRSPYVRKSECRNPGISFLACWIPESGKIVLVESGILSFGIQNTAQGIRNPTRRNQLTVRYCQKEREMSNPEFSFHH